ncbi:MAG: M48 family metallopeptidase [Rhizobacter sp.]|nr:M48 family metallopeptidase [Bacteriovorax sp.]
MNSDGKYYDGKSPVSIPVTCMVTADGLVILRESTDEIIAQWKRENIFQDENHNTAIVLGNKLDKAKIEILNNNITGMLRIGSSEKIVKNGRRFIFKWIGIVVIVCLALWAMIPIATNFIAVRIPYSLEVSATSNMNFDTYFKSCTLNPEQEHALKVYVDFLYPKNKFEKEMPVTFKIGNNPMINALTFPGGRVYIMKGLLDEVKNPQELLGVMGHEIGHVVARDSAGFFVRGTLLASFFGFMTGDFHSSFAVSPQILLSTAALTFDREMEKKADAYAAGRLTMLDVSTSGLRSFFSRLGNESGNFSAPEIMMTHPNFESRLSLIKETYPKSELPIEITSNWKIIKAICK